jgi:hypothetical protein
MESEEEGGEVEGQHAMLSVDCFFPLAFDVCISPVVVSWWFFFSLCVQLMGKNNKHEMSYTKKYIEILMFSCYLKPFLSALLFCMWCDVMM